METELHVEQVLLSKMPIIIVSADSNNVQEFDKVDILFESENQMSNYKANLRVSVAQLNPPSENESIADIQCRFQSVVNAVRKMNVSSCIIVSHHSVINTWKTDFIQDNPEIIEM